MRPVRTGVVGVGRLGAEHARVLTELEESRLVGVHDRRSERAREVADRTGARVFSDLGGLLAEVEAAVVAVPTRSHHSVARAALEAGRHALVEKPLAADLDEVDDLRRTAAAQGVLLATGRIERFNPAVRAGRGHVGRPRFLVAERLAPFRRRGTDVGVVLDLMIHDLDLVLDMTGERVREVEAVGVSVLTGSVDLANARLTFRGGAVAEITASRVSTRSSRRLRIFQETGYLSLDLGTGGGEFLRRTAPGLPVEAGDGLEDVVERERLAGEGNETEEPLRRELRAFLGAVREEDEDAAVVTADEARPALELALRITREIEESTHVPA